MRVMPDISRSRLTHSTVFGTMSALMSDRRRGHRLVSGIVVIGGLAMMAACGSDDGVSASPRSPAQTLGAIQITPINAIIAVGDTVRISVSGKTLTNEPLASFDSVRYVLQNITDTIRVQVSQTGVVTGRASSDNYPVLLNVFAFKGGLVRGEQAIIQVTPTAFAGATLSIQPDVGDSTRLAQGSSKSITPVITNGTESVPNPSLRFIIREADATKMGCYVPSFSGIGNFTNFQLNVTNCGTQVGLNQIAALAHSGTAWVIAEANVYGTVLRDSVQYTLTYPFWGYVMIASVNLQLVGGSTLGTLYLAPGGMATFFNFINPNIGAAVAFTLDNPAAALPDNPPSSTGGASGNVTTLQSYEGSNRRFVTPGTYTYTATVTSPTPPFTDYTVTGQIVVQ